MHLTSMNNCKQFFDTYSKDFLQQEIKVIEIGSQDINGSLRSCCPENYEYIGVDFVAGKGVDVILEDPYSLPFETGVADIVLSSSCFEHSEMFWLLFLEIMRILKPSGLFYLNSPSNGIFHRYPVDCWRFYPDSARAMVSWAKHNGMKPALLESYTSAQYGDIWNDFVAVFLRDEKYLQNYPDRILLSKTDIYNGVVFGNDDYINYTHRTEDMNKLFSVQQIIGDDIKCY